MVANALFQIGEQRAALPDRAFERAEAVVHEHDIGSLARDVGSGPSHRNADFRGCERRCVIDPIAGNGNTLILPGQGLHDLQLLLGRGPRQNRGMTDCLLAQPIARHHGIIDKFIGDGAMAIFGVPEPRDDDARNAVLAGVALVSVIDAWCSERLAEGLPPVEVGIGIHYGDVIAGALGDEHRLEYTVVGDAVNTAARIERLAADLGTPLLVSADVLAVAPTLQQDLKLAEPVTHLLRGRSQPIRLYQLGASSSKAGAHGT